MFFILISLAILEIFTFRTAALVYLGSILFIEIPLTIVSHMGSKKESSE